MEKKLFLVCDGPDGGGKTTQINLLKVWLEEHGLRVLVTKEPGSPHDPICKEIRATLLNREYKSIFSFRAELLLYEADRAQHIHTTIIPALSCDSPYDIVISDRFEASSAAYQCYARGIVSESEFEKLNGFATDGLRPDFTFWMDVDPIQGLSRKGNDGELDRLESEGNLFHQKVREGYGLFFKKFYFPGTYEKIDSTLPAEEIFLRIKDIFKEKGFLV